MPVVKVSTPKYCTAPNSLRVSISASDTPPTMAGRASGMAMLVNSRQGPRPRVRPTSSTHTDCSRKLARASM